MHHKTAQMLYEKKIKFIFVTYAFVLFLLLCVSVPLHGEKQSVRLFFKIIVSSFKEWLHVWVET